MALGGGALHANTRGLVALVYFLFFQFFVIVRHAEKKISNFSEPQNMYCCNAVTDNEIYLNCYGKVPKKLKMYLMLLI